MATKQKNDVAPEAEQAEETVVTPETPETEGAEAPVEEEVKAEVNETAAADDRFLRLAAEYDNFRKRTAKEKESIWTEAKAQTVAAFPFMTLWRAPASRQPPTRPILRVWS